MFNIDYEFICQTEEGAVYRVMWADGKSKMVLIRNEDLDDDEEPKKESP